MNANSFFLYFVLPAFTLFLIFTNRYYYSKKDSRRMRFNMREDLFFGNIVGPIVGLIGILALYAKILNIQYLSQLRWEILAIFTITLMSLLLGIGLGGHIAAVSIEKSLKNKKFTEETDDILFFFHWPFGHKLTYIPAALVIYVVVLLDLFKGSPEILKPHQEMLLIVLATGLAIATSISFVITHVTRIMFYTLLVLVSGLFFALRYETVTLKEHPTAFFFAILCIAILIMMAIYRYIHHVSKPLHTYIHSKFRDGDKVIED